jgi:hypothetical protein
MSAPLTSERLAEIAARAEAATPGPWGSHRDLAGVYTVQVNPRVIPGFGSVTEGDVAQILTREDDKAYANVRFIAHAREDVPALLARIAELEDFKRRVIEEVEEFEDAANDDPATPPVARHMIRLLRMAMAEPAEGGAK